MKTGRLRHVRILAPTCSANLEWGRRVEHSYDGHADLFIIVCPDDPRLLAIPVREAPARKITLRVAPSRNGLEARRPLGCRPPFQQVASSGAVDTVPEPPRALMSQRP